MAQRIISLCPPHDVYIEPFLGAAAVMRAKRPAAVNIGLDLDPEAPGLAWIACQRQTRAEAIACSSINGNGGERRRTAADLVVHPGVTVSAATTWIAEVADGLEYLRSYPFTGREVVFCDPPYLQATRTERRLYKWEWWTDKHRQLLQLLVTLPCHVMLSGYPSSLYREHLAGWNSVNYDAMTRGGTTRDEWLWFNFPKPLELHDYRYLGEGYRERERIKKKKKRWTEKLRKMPALERQALLAALQEVGQ